MRHVQFLDLLLTRVRQYRNSHANQWEAFLGLHVQSQTNDWREKRNVRRIIVHHEYDNRNYNNDIALMELDANVTLNQNIWPICLPSPSYDFPAGAKAWITGWGTTTEGGECRFLLDQRGRNQTGFD